MFSMRILLLAASVCLAYASIKHQDDVEQMSIKRKLIVGGFQLNHSIMGFEVGKTKPFMAGIRQEADGINFCGGSFIHPKLVLTAAHCLYSAKYKINYVSAGSIDNKGTAGESVRVVKSTPHPEYAHDQTSRPSNRDHAPSLVGTRVKTFGWGIVANPRTHLRSAVPSPKLKQLNVKVISGANCLLESRGTPIFGNENKVVCTYKGKKKVSDSVGKGTCNGDSGGPLIIDSRVHSPTVIGVVMKGDNECGEYPSGYARVSYSLDFIQQMLRSV